MPIFGSRKVGRFPPIWVAEDSVKSGNRGEWTSDERDDHRQKAVGIGSFQAPVGLSDA